MAQYFTNFDGQAAGQTPSNFNANTDWSDGFTTFVTATNPAITPTGDVRSLQFSDTGNAQTSAAWFTDVPEVPDTQAIEVFATLQRDSTALDNSQVSNAVAVARFPYTARGYLLGFDRGADALSIRRYDGSEYPVSSRLNEVASIATTGAFPENAFYNIKAQLEPAGGSLFLRVKAWRIFDAEPAGWMLEYEDPDPLTGDSKVGVASAYQFYVNTLDRFGVGTDGDPAPTEAPAPGGEGTTVNPPAAETEAQSFAPAVTSGASVFPATAITESLAYAPSVSTGASVSPPVADTIAQAHAPEVATGASVSPPAADTNSAAHDPLVSSGAAIYPPTASTESEARAPVIATGASVAPPTAATDSKAHAPIVGSVVIVQPPAAITKSLAHAPIISAGASAFPPSADTVESANDPAVSSGASVLVPAAITVTDAHDPTVSAGILPFVRKVTIRGTMTRKVTLSGNMNRKASIPGTLTRKVRL